MAEENGDGKRAGLLDRVHEDAKACSEYVKEKGKEEIEGLKDPEKTQLYRSIFRVKHDDTPRNRSLSVLSQRFLSPASRQSESRRREIQLHLGHGRHHFLSVHRADLYRRSADVLLPPHQGAGLPRHSVSGKRRARSASCCATCTAGPRT